MLPVLIAIGASFLVGAVAGKTEQKKAIEKPVYKATMLRKNGSIETLIGSLLGAWTAAVEREISLRVDPNPIVTMTLFSPDGKVIRTFPQS